METHTEVIVATCPHPRCFNAKPCSVHTASTKSPYTYRWQQARKRFLREHPTCEYCKPRVTLATVVDHRIPHRGDTQLFWDQRNWMASCKACHDRKTATEDRTSA